MNNKVIVFGAAVALVILVDLATGQGPPVYTNYLRAREDMRQGPPPGPMMAGYLAQAPPPAGLAVYGDPKELEKEFNGKSDKLEHKKDDKSKDKPKDKEYEDKEYGHGQEKYDKEKGGTTAPGIYDRIMKSIGR